MTSSERLSRTSLKLNCVWEFGVLKENEDRPKYFHNLFDMTSLKYASIDIPLTKSKISLVFS